MDREEREMRMRTWTWMKSKDSSKHADRSIVLSYVHSYCSTWRFSQEPLK